MTATVCTRCQAQYALQGDTLCASCRYTVGSAPIHTTVNTPTTKEGSTMTTKTSKSSTKTAAAKTVRQELHAALMIALPEYAEEYNAGNVAECRSILADGLALIDSGMTVAEFVATLTAPATAPVAMQEATNDDEPALDVSEVLASAACLLEALLKSLDTIGYTLRDASIVRQGEVASNATLPNVEAIAAPAVNGHKPAGEAGQKTTTRKAKISEKDVPASAQVPQTPIPAPVAPVQGVEITSVVVGPDVLTSKGEEVKSDQAEWDALMTRGKALKIKGVHLCKRIDVLRAKVVAAEGNAVPQTSTAPPAPVAPEVPQQPSSPVVEEKADDKPSSLSKPHASDVYVAGLAAGKSYRLTIKADETQGTIHHKTAGYIVSKGKGQIVNGTLVPLTGTAPVAAPAPAAPKVEDKPQQPKPQTDAVKTVKHLYVRTDIGYRLATKDEAKAFLAALAG